MMRWDRKKIIIAQDRRQFFPGKCQRNKYRFDSRSIASRKRYARYKRRVTAGPNRFESFHANSILTTLNDFRNARVAVQCTYWDIDNDGRLEVKINKRKKISGRYRRRNNKLLYNAYGDVGMAINLKLIGITDGLAIFSCVPAVFLWTCDTRAVNRYLRNCKSRIETLAVFILICNLKRSFYRICTIFFSSICTDARNGFEFRNERYPATLR